MAAPWRTSAAHFTRPAATACVCCDAPSVGEINGEPHCRAHAENARIDDAVRASDCPSCEGGTGLLCAPCRRREEAARG